MVARYSKFELFQVKATIAHHFINDLMADWDLFSYGRPILLLNNEKRAMSIRLTVSEIHSKVPNMLGTWDKSAVYITCYESSARQKYLELLHLPVHM